MQPNLSKSSTSLTSQGRHRHHHCQSYHHHAHHIHHPHHSQPHLRHHPLQSEHHQQQEQYHFHHHHQQHHYHPHVHNHPPHQNNDEDHEVGNNLYGNVAYSDDVSSNQPCRHHHHHQHLPHQQHLQTLPHRSSTHNHPLPSPPHKSPQQPHHHHHHHHRHQYEYSSSDNDFHNDTTDAALPEPAEAHVHSSVSELTQQCPKNVVASSKNEVTTTTATTATTEERRLDSSDVYDHVNDYDDLGLSNCCCCFKSCCGESLRRQCAYRCSKGLTRFTRLFLIIPNLVFLVFGSAMIGMAVWIRSERESYFYVEILNRIPVGPLLTFDKFPVLIIAVGSCILILSFLACCGACAESICFLYLYTTFLVIILVTEVTLGVMALVMRDQIQLKLETAMQNQIKYDYNSTDTSLIVASQMTDQSGIQELEHLAYIQHITMAWDRLQMQFDCCGAVDPSDYIHSLWQNRSNHASTKVPPSCCFRVDDADDTAHPNWLKTFQNCQSEMTAHKNNWVSGSSARKEGKSILKTQGCKEALMTILQKNFTLVIVGVVVIVILQMLDFILACVLMKYFRRKMENSSWYEDDDFD